MSRLSPDARDTLRIAEVSQTAWIRHHFGDDAKTWGGDACGCPDGRCIGYHHDAHDDCGCLTALLYDYIKALRDVPRDLGGSKYLPDYDEDQNAAYHEQLTAELSDESPADVTTPGGNVISARYWRIDDEDGPIFFRTEGARAWGLGYDGATWSPINARVFATMRAVRIDVSDLPAKALPGSREGADR